MKSRLRLKRKKVTKATRLKMSMARKGMVMSADFRKNCSLSKIGKKNPNYGKKISDSVKAKIRKANSGSRCHLWKGGISFIEYPRYWTKELKRQIRERDRYTCRLCGKVEENKPFDVHHINYNKRDCRKKNLVTLCRNCHMKTNIRRSEWHAFFLKKIK